ncbi:MAG: hypothetical protein FWD92_05160, partial [Methanomassiliicoccaceae archaeon]|nr:hypothetical protein [Methanomassiliicoccaceae archaeon]
EEGAELTLKNGNVTIGGVDLTGGKLILDSTVLTILGDLTGSGDVELIDDSELVVKGDVNIDGNITGSGNLDVDGNVNIDGNLNIDGSLGVGGDADIDGSLGVGGDADIGGNLDVGKDVNIGGNLDVGKDVNIDGDLNLGGDLIVNGEIISVKGIDETYHYTGSEIIPDIMVTYNGELLEEGADYMITYSDNINAGEAKVKIEFIGDYGHIPTMTRSFSIVEEDYELSSSAFITTASLLITMLLIAGLVRKIL